MEAAEAEPEGKGSPQKAAVIQEAAGEEGEGQEIEQKEGGSREGSDDEEWEKQPDDAADGQQEAPGG